ncbi:hypothetical protein MOKP126_50210 [Mycobacterium avium subsp. hominissuis]
MSEGYLWEHDLADWRWGIDVNVLGVIHGLKAFVPILLERGEGHVVNTCSGNGGFAPIARGAMGGPATAVYPMTKAAVLCVTESLYTHLEMTGTRVRAHVLFPGGFLNTGIWESWRHRPPRYARRSNAARPSRRWTRWWPGSRPPAPVSSSPRWRRWPTWWWTALRRTGSG